MKSNVSISERIGYSAIEVGNQFSWTMISTYLAVFYTDVVGIVPAAVSMILLAARIWDGVNDPIMGAIAERTDSRWGRFRPYLIFGAPVLSLFSILTFSNMAHSAGMTVKIIYAAVTYIGCGMAYTVVCISHGSIVNVMTRDSGTRMELNALRQMGSGIAGLVINAITMPLILFFGNGSTSSGNGYLVTTILLSLVGCACIMYGGITCKERIRPKRSAEKISVWANFKVVLTNKDILLIVINGVFTAGAILGRMGVLSYYFIYYVGNASLMAPAMVLYSVFTIIAQVFVPFLTKKLTKKWACVLSYVMAGASLALIFSAAPSNSVLILSGSAFNGLSNFAPGILYGIAGDVIDADEVKTGRRVDGITYAMLSLGTKIGIAVGGAVSVALLGVIGYVPNAQQTASTLSGLNMIANIAPIAFHLLGALTVIFMSINDKKALENRKILEERSAAAE